MPLCKHVAELIFHRLFYKNSFLAKQIITYLGTPVEVFEMSRKDLSFHLTPEWVKKISQRNIKQAEIDFKLCEKSKIKWLTILDDEYPNILKQIYDPPFLFFYRGQIPNLDKSPSIAIIGSRRATRYGREIAYNLSRDLVAKGMVITSGMAYGIDSIAHRGAVDMKSTTLAILGSGLNNIYPITNLDLAEKISQKGAVISEFPLEETPYQWNFPQRNRVISGLSIGVLVVEATLKSGTLITVREALSQGKEVFAIPGQVGHLNARGTNHLIKNGAKMVEEIDDIYLELKNILPQKHQWHNNMSDIDCLPEDDVRNSLIKLLQNKPLIIDEIIAFLRRDLSVIMTAILELQCKGLIKEIEGKRFTLC